MKRIIVCCDGTWNKPGSKDQGMIVKTNVQKLFEAVDNYSSKVNQVKYYGQGVGTGFSLRDQFLGGSTGMGIDFNIQDAYKFIMWTYQPGDQLYLFGFSRGAYTVRSLAGLIRNCGIMKPAYLHLVREAYQLYRDRTPLTHPDSDLMKSFKRSYGIDEEETNIKFMGVWDTVGALGIPLIWLQWLNKKYTFHDVKLGSQINYAYHALAVDERRKVFEPALWEISEAAQNRPNPQVCEQVWFPGVHSNVGGGYADCGLSDTAFKWMIEKARDTGLEFNENYLEPLNADSCGVLRRSTTGIYTIMRKRIRAINTGFAVRIDPVTGNTFKVQVTRNESIHYSCMERRYKDKTYLPTNIEQAISSQTPFNPLKENWNPNWLGFA